MPVTVAGRKVHPLTAILLALLILLFFIILIPLLILFAGIYLLTATLRALFSPRARTSPTPPDEGRRNVRIIQSSPPPTAD